MSLEDELTQITTDVRIEKSTANIHQTLDPTKKITATQAKALNAVQYKLQQLTKDLGLSVSQFHKNHQGNLVVSMPSHEFRRLINCESRNTQYLRNIMLEIKNLSAAEDTLDPEKGKGRLYFRNLFISAEYTEANFTFEIPEETTRLLVTDTPSAVIDVLTVAQKLSSKYSVFLNDLLEEWSYSEQSDDFKVIIEDERFRNLMKIPFKMNGRVKEYSYKQPSILIRKAIDPAVTEINDANLRFEIQEYSHVKKEGKIYWVFKVSSKKTMLIHQFTAKNAVELADTRKQLKDIKVSDEAIRTLLATVSSDYELAYIKYNIDIVKAQAKRGKAGNPGGLFMSCMERNRESFEPIWTQMRLEREVELSIKKKEYEERLRKEREMHINELIENLASLKLEKLGEDPAAVSHWRDAFKEHLENVPLPAAKKISTALTKNPESLDFVVEPMFLAFMKAHVKKGLTEEQIENFIRSKGSTLQV